MWGGSPNIWVRVRPPAPNLQPPHLIRLFPAVRHLLNRHHLVSAHVARLEKAKRGDEGCVGQGEDLGGT